MCKQLFASKPFAFALFAAVGLSATTAAADEGEWLILPPQTGSGLGAKIEAVVNDAMREEVKDAKVNAIAEKKVTKMLAAIGAKNITGEDLADLAVGMDAGHALLVLLEKKGAEITVTVYRYDTKTTDLSWLKEKTRKVGVLRAVRSLVQNVLVGRIGDAAGTKKSLAKALKEDMAAAKAERRSLGVTVRPVDKKRAKQLGMNRVAGAWVSEVASDGAGVDAGLKKDDVIMSIEGQEIPDLKTLAKLIKTAPIDRQLNMLVWRNGDYTSLPLFLGSVPAGSKPAKATAEPSKPKETAPPPPKVEKPASTTAEKPKEEKPADAPPPKKRKLGVGAKSLDAAGAAKLGMAEAKGALVAKVTDGTPAAEAGVKVGDVLLSIDGRPITHPRDIATVAGAAAANRTVVLTVWRDGAVKKLPLFLSDK